MPSTHSSSIAFFGVYLSLCIWNLRPHPRFLPHLLSRDGDSGDFSPVVRLFLTSTVLYGAASVCWSRVKLTYHTQAQVVAGVAVGAIIAVGWFILWQERIKVHAKWVEGLVDQLLAVSVDSWRTRSVQPLRENVAGLSGQWRARYGQRGDQL